MGAVATAPTRADSAASGLSNVEGRDATLMAFSYPKRRVKPQPLEVGRALGGAPVVLRLRLDRLTRAGSRPRIPAEANRRLTFRNRGLKHVFETCE
jgi:hypothetical protein